MVDPNYPRPQFVRPDWHLLDGTWSFAFSELEDLGNVPWQGWIKVPFPPESAFSGVNEPEYHPVVWYQRRFEFPDAWRDRRILLHFGAVDYAAKVWVNGRFVTQHEGGHTPFHVDITDVVVEGEQIVTVRAEDDPLDMEKPRGKQDWEQDPHVIWYPRTSGIWQPVWLEAVYPTRIASLRITPDVRHFCLGLDVTVAGDPGGLALDVKLSLHGNTIVEDTWGNIGPNLQRWIGLPDPGVDNARKGFLWSPEHPTLFDLELTLRRGEMILDQVQSYAALRSIDAKEGAFYLNGHPYFMQFVLDQGYWPETHMAAPSHDALKRDVELTKSLGFNGVRKHQKIEDPRYLYWADRLGLLVWAEMPSFYRFSTKSTLRMVNEFIEVIQRDYNHPCIVAWVPFNESWGLNDLRTSADQRNLLKSIYHLAKSLDSTRLVVDNDGWEHLCTDVLTVHDYLNEPEQLSRRYGSHDALQKTIKKRPVGRDLALDGVVTDGLPVVLSEFGGLRLKEGEGWGYGDVESPEEFLRKFRDLMDSVGNSALAGFCYTQLADTYQEQTGLLYADRRPKLEPETVQQALRNCMRQRRASEV